MAAPFLPMTLLRELLPWSSRVAGNLYARVVHSCLPILRPILVCIQDSTLRLHREHEEQAKILAHAVGYGSKEVVETTVRCREQLGNNVFPRESKA